MHFYQSFLTLLAFGASLATAQVLGGGGRVHGPVSLACPRHSQCTSDGSGCTGSLYGVVADQCT
ncbi:uncharacterized protein N7479_007604 [Penicillium vulpinum]|uniref:uncharacterized protein n=1 Tax=Penicillium vulpinum TaxID=29845 RepID=UPI0025479E1D|nr:uncharacterized protein N7479_007604 [Penicillium vulpinum]KAJ5960454.1 hypothetical protein N7479_007604 [Penicillium vulpinum]